MPTRYCDGIDRRSFLRLGGLAAGGLTLPDLFAGQQAAGATTSHRHKSVIMVYLTGGISHQDTFDLKPNSPSEVRGEFKPIATNRPGFQVCELLPNLARMADKYSIVRSVVGLVDEHSSFQNITGYTMGVTQRDGRPSFGSVASKRLGPVDPVVPPFVDLFPTMQHRPYNSPTAGVIGRSHSGVKVDGGSLAIMKPKDQSPDQLFRRRALLEQFDGFRRSVDNASLVGMDGLYGKAFTVLNSSKLVEALDVDKEPLNVRERYGRGSPNHQGDGAPLWNDQLLMARRLVEAGVRCVTVAYGFWDTHGNNFGHLRQNLPVFDQGVSALIQDIHDRGLDKDVTLVVWGEFGRTPKINANAGRDHWSRVSNALVAGGDMKMGQTIGATDSIAGYAVDRPVHFHEVLGTIYHNLGIAPDSFVSDIAGRPMPVLSTEAQPIAELIG